MAYQNILTRTENSVGLVQLNRPESYNALSPILMQELMEALETYAGNLDIGCMVIYGNDKAFAAGADIKFMAGSASPADMLSSPLLEQWQRLSKIKKPIIAAVSGFALGGGCELAMACDMIVASESARFGQPEINLGVIPGAGGTQRMTLAVGKALAMEMILNNRHLSAKEAQHFGLVNKVSPVASYLQDAIIMASEIAARAPLAIRMAKEAINAVFEMPLQSGLDHERSLFSLLFSTEDQKEGMNAFINKRQPKWQGK